MSGIPSTPTACSIGPGSKARRAPSTCSSAPCLQAYHGEGRNPAAPEVLLEAATAAGLDAERARAVIAGTEFTDEVREAEQFWQQAGINAVPAVVINRRHLVSGGQPPAVFAQALRKIAAED